MGSLPVLNTSDLWLASLYIAVMAATLSLTAGAMFAWRRRPVKKDDLQRYKLNERLMQISSGGNPAPKNLL
jgi:hypothetical protein